MFHTPIRELDKLSRIVLLTWHEQVYEKSRFAAETGAALLLSSNGARVVSRLGFSFERARDCHLKAWDTLDGTTLAKIGGLNLEDAEKRYGAPLMSVHRVDLHNELLRLASTDDTANDAPKVILRLNSRVIGASVEEGTIELADETVDRADLIVAADGVHSVLRSVVVGTEASAASPTGSSAFRFLIPTANLLDDPLLVDLLTQKCKGPTILADTQDPKSERHIVWYDCRGSVIQILFFESTSVLMSTSGEIQNLVGVIPSSSDDKAEKSISHHTSCCTIFGKVEATNSYLPSATHRSQGVDA